MKRARTAAPDLDDASKLLAEFERGRDALLQRRRLLLDEIARIDMTLGQSRKPAQPRVRREGSMMSRIETFVFEHPDCLAKDVYEALDLSDALVGTSLINLVQAGRLTRRRDSTTARGLWRYSPIGTITEGSK